MYHLIIVIKQSFAASLKRIPNLKFYQYQINSALLKGYKELLVHPTRQNDKME